MNTFFLNVGPADTHRLTKLKQQLQASGTATSNQVETANNVDNTKHLQRDHIKNEIETILAAECLFCGEHMINNIDKPFIEDWERVNLDWQ